MNRTEKALRNIVVSSIGYVCVVLSDFVARTVILKYMGLEIVGVGQLFSNIFMLLSYTSLGLETSIVYSLYEPLKNQDTSKICLIMDFYKKVFRIMEMVIIGLAVLILPLIRYMVKDSENVNDIYMILIMYALVSASSYFFAYKRSICIADQNRYISTAFTDVSSIVKLILQAIIISLTQNYVLYMLTNIVVVISNFLLAKQVDRKYGFLKDKARNYLEANEKKTLVKTTFATIEQKLGFVVIFAIDSILMSAFLGVKVVGMYANYLLIINGLQTGIAILFQSVTAGVGDLAVSENSSERLREIWNILNFVAFWIYAFSTVCLIVLFNPFIELWIGEKYTFSIFIVVFIAMNFYVMGMRKPVIMCKDALGIQWNDRWKPWVEALLNLVLSLTFLYIFNGIEGILLGTILSMLLSSCWIEPYMLYKYGLDGEKVSKYIWTYMKQLTLMGGMIFITYYISRYMNLINCKIVAFIFKLLLCVLVPNIVFILVTFRKREFMTIRNMAKNIMKKGR